MRQDSREMRQHMGSRTGLMEAVDQGFVKAKARRKTIGGTATRLSEGFVEGSSTCPRRTACTYLTGLHVCALRGLGLLPRKKVGRIAGFEQTIPGIKDARTVYLELFENMIGKVNWCRRVGGNEIAVSHHQLVLIERLAT